MLMMSVDVFFFWFLLGVDGLGFAGECEDEGGCGRAKGGDL